MLGVCLHACMRVRVESSARFARGRLEAANKLSALPVEAQDALFVALLRLFEVKSWVAPAAAANGAGAFASPGSCG